jgi:FixJ family two-component response regulator
MSPDPIVHIVDDDPSVLRSLGRLLRSAGLKAATFNSPDAFLAQLNGESDGCLVLDVALPGANGLDLQTALAARGCLLPIVFITGRGDIPMSVRAMKAGAVDFLQKPFKSEALLAAVRAALEKNRRARQEQAERNRLDAWLTRLTPREREVLPYIIGGNLNKQTAFELGTAEKTIKVHRARVLKKLGVTSVAELARLAERAGIKPAVVSQ